MVDTFVEIYWYSKWTPFKSSSSKWYKACKSKDSCPKEVTSLGVVRLGYAWIRLVHKHPWENANLQKKWISRLICFRFSCFLIVHFWQTLLWLWLLRNDFCCCCIPNRSIILNTISNPFCFWNTLRLSRIVTGGLIMLRVVMGLNPARTRFYLTSKLENYLFNHQECVFLSSLLLQTR